MTITIAGNLISEGDTKCFALGANRVGYFELGHAVGTDVWLEGQLAGPDEEFLFNGRLFIPNCAGVGTIIDNFPKAPAPKGWVIRKHVDEPGYDLFNSELGAVLFGYRVRGNECLVTTSLYNSRGHTVAVAALDGLVVRGISLRLGRFGIRLAA